MLSEHMRMTSKKTGKGTASQAENSTYDPVLKGCGFSRAVGAAKIAGL
jgi:hypothetical protein